MVYGLFMCHDRPACDSAYILLMCQYENKKSQIEMFLKIWIFIS